MILSVQQVQTNAVTSLQVAAQAAMAAMVVNAMAGMSEFVAGGMALSAGMTGSTKGQASARAEYEELNERLRKRAYVTERYRSSVVSLRDRRGELVKQYKIAGAIPPLVELRRKYPQLYATERNLKTAEEQLNRLELGNMLLYKRKKELAMKLGISVGAGEEIPKHVQYTQTKKFIPKTGIY